MRRALVSVTVFAATLLQPVSTTSLASPDRWASSVPFTTQVASSPFEAGGYPVPAGRDAPLTGSCRLGDYNANASVSWIAVQPGTENLVGTAKVFFENFSTFYDLHLGSYTIEDGAPVANNIVHGHECVSTGTQDMPQLEEQHGSQRRLRHSGSRLPGHASVQSLVGELHPPRHCGRRLLQR